MAETARLDIDCDGVLLRKYPLLHPLNASKYPLPLVPGVIELLQGFEDAHGEIGKIVTARPEWLRGRLTRRSLSDTGLTRFFDPLRDIVYVGTDEHLKAEAITRAPSQPTGFIDDHPERVGVHLVNHMRAIEVGRQVITLGVAPSSSQSSRVDELLSSQDREDTKIEELDHGHMAIHVEHGVLVLSAFAQFSQEGGEQFAQLVRTNDTLY